MNLTGVNLRVQLAERLMLWQTKAGTSEWHSRIDKKPVGYLLREEREKPLLPIWRPDENLQQAFECLGKLAERFPVDYVIDNYSVNMWRRRVDAPSAPAVSRPYNLELNQHALATALCQCVAALEELGQGDRPLPIEKQVQRSECDDPQKRFALNRKRARYLEECYDRPWTFKK